MLLLRLPPSAPDIDEFPVVESPCRLSPPFSNGTSPAKSRSGFLQRKWRRFGRCEGGLLQKAAPMCSQCGNLVTEVPMISLDRKAQVGRPFGIKKKAKRARILAMPEPVCPMDCRMKGARKPRTPPPEAIQFQFFSPTNSRNSYITILDYFPFFLASLKQRKSSLDSNFG